MLLTCNKYKITPHAIFAGTRGSYGAEALELALSPDWEGLAVRLCFYPADGSAGVTVAYSGEPVTIPSEATAASGYGRLTVVGTRGDTVMITLAATLVVADTPQPVDAQPSPPTPSEYAQLRDLINNNIGVSEGIQAAAEAAQAAAETAQTAAEAAQTAAEASAAEAAESVAGGQYVGMEIRGDGCLYFTKTDDLSDVSFAINANGELEVEVA